MEAGTVSLRISLKEISYIVKEMSILYCIANILKVLIPTYTPGHKQQGSMVLRLNNVK